MPTPLALVRRWFLLLLPWSAENFGPDDATRDGVQRHVLRVYDKIPLDKSTSRLSKNNTFSVAREIIATGFTYMLLFHNISSDFPGLSLCGLTSRGLVRQITKPALHYTMLGQYPRRSGRYSKKDRA